jgi:hypothetical protein
VLLLFGLPETEILLQPTAIIARMILVRIVNARNLDSGIDVIPLPL